LELLQSCVVNLEQQRRHAEDLIARGDDAPSNLRLAAWLAAISGDTIAAERHLSNARQHLADAGEAWFATGLLHIAKADHEAARRAFEQAVLARFPAGATREQLITRVRSYDPTLNRFAIFEILYDTFEHAFCCFLFPVSIGTIERQGYAFCVERAFNRLGPTEATAALLQEDRRLNGETMWYWICLGHVHWIALRRDDADYAYIRARQLAIEHKIIPYHFDCGAMVWLNRPDAEKLLRPERPAGAPNPASRWTFRFSDDGEANGPHLALVLGCDSQYFKFFPKFLLSVIEAQIKGEHDARIVVHCHIADPLPDQLNFLDTVSKELARSVPEIVISYSFGPPDHYDPGYYTCLRFLVLPEILARYGCGVMALDIDSTLDDQFFAHLQHITTFDFAFRMYNFTSDTNRQVGGEPWSIGAHPTYVSSTPSGRIFAGFMRDYIAAAYDPTLPTNWTIDQCAIAQGYDLLIRNDPDRKVLNVAYYSTIYHLPHEFGGKEGFLDAGGRVTMDNFRDRLTAVMGTRTLKRGSL
jgi:hypothetical protein